MTSKSNGMDACTFMTRTIQDHSSDVPIIVCKLLLCIPVTSIECERTFSTQNRIKNKLRNRLGEERVDVLIKIT